MTPEEKSLHSLPLYLIGDEVEIAGTGIVGEVTGINIVGGDEDKYQVFYVDHAGNPQERWWRASDLDEAGDDEPESNVIPFPTYRVESIHRGNKTRH